MAKRREKGKMAEKAEKRQKKLTDLQERFCLEYVIDLHATNAIVRAGSKSKYPETLASQFLKKTQVQHKIAELKEIAARRNAISQDKVIGAFAEIGFLDPAEMFDEDEHLVPLRSMPLSVRRAIAGIEIEEKYQGRGKDRVKTSRIKKLKLCSKNDALEKLAKHLGLFERDNSQKRSLTLVEILAIVNGSRDTGPS